MAIPAVVVCNLPEPLTLSNAVILLTHVGAPVRRTHRLERALASPDVALTPPRRAPETGLGPAGAVTRATGGDPHALARRRRRRRPGWLLVRHLGRSGRS